MKRTPKPAPRSLLPWPAPIAHTLRFAVPRFSSQDSDRVAESRGKGENHNAPLWSGKGRGLSGWAGVRGPAKSLYADYPGLVSRVKPELYRNADGTVGGITARGLAEVPLARQLGLEEGDVLQSVNNERIDSQQKVLEMIQKYQNAGSFSVGILRNGKQKTISYNFY